MFFPQHVNCRYLIIQCHRSLKALAILLKSLTFISIYCRCQSQCYIIHSFRLVKKSNYCCEYFGEGNSNNGHMSLWNFNSQTYFGYDVENGSDEISREARKAMIKTYGQTPQQLFTSPHPPANNSGSTQSPQVSGSLSSFPLLLFSPFMQLIPFNC